MPTYGSRWPTYAKQWDAMQRTRVTAETSAAQRALAMKARYQAVEAKTGVPWAMIAVIHMRESDFDFDTQLAQGDPLNRVSTHVPRGQGPYTGPDAWERAAFIALEDSGLLKVKDWRLEKVLYYLEAYNGWGYANRGVPSAYLWAGSNQYSQGKYVGDGDWSSTAKDQQLGTAPVLKTIMELDPTVQFEHETPPGVADKPLPAPPPPIPPDQAKLPETKPMLDQQTIATMIIGLVGLYPPAAPFVPLIQKAVPIGFKIWNDLHDDTKNQITPLLFQAINQFITERNKQA